MTSKPSCIRSVATLRKEVRKHRGLYAALLDLLERSSGPIPRQIPRDLVKDYYAEIAEDIEAGRSGDRSERWIRMRFRAAVLPLSDLVNRVHQALVVLSARTTQARCVLDAFSRLPLVVQYTQFVKYAPYQTLENLDVIIELLGTALNKPLADCEQEQELDGNEGKSRPEARPQETSATNVPAVVSAEQDLKNAVSFDRWKLRWARAEIHLFRQKDAAAFFGVNLYSYRRWETGKTPTMYRDHYDRYRDFIRAAEENRKLPPPDSTQTPPTRSTHMPAKRV